MPRLVSTNGAGLSVMQRAGIGESLVFIHGLADSAAAWTRVVAAIGPYYDVTTYDLRGHGGSSASATGYGVEVHAADLVGLLQSLSLHEVTLIGHSLGAEIAARVAQLHPERVTSLVMVEPPWHLESVRESPKRMEATLASWLGWLAQFRGKSIAEVVEVARTTNPEWHEFDIQTWAESRIQVLPEAIVSLAECRPSWESTVAKLVHPTLLIFGDSKFGSTVTAAQAIKAAQITSRLSLAHIAGAGHGIYRDRFDDFVQQLGQFLRR